jgi:hypothetical protein
MIAVAASLMLFISMEMFSPFLLGSCGYGFY